MCVLSKIENLKCVKEKVMEFRKVFDTIPEQFDKYRPRYSEKLFAELVSYADIKPGKKILELGPGTGQATEPILNTGCDYTRLNLAGIWLI